MRSEMIESSADDVNNPSVIMNLVNTLCHEGFMSYLVRIDDNKENMPVEPTKRPLNLNFSLYLGEDAYFNRFREN